jgi:hypothetical protein
MNRMTWDWGLHTADVQHRGNCKPLDADPLTFFTSRLGGAGGVWLVSMNRLVLRLSGAKHKMQYM